MVDIKWHFIGHLQSNKVRQIVGRVEMIARFRHIEHGDDQ